MPSTFQYDILIEILGDLLSKTYTWAIAKALKAGIPTTLRIHCHELRTRLRHMPFIYYNVYRNLSSEVLRDFVEIRMATIDSKSFEEIPSGRRARMSTEERIRTRRVAIFLGSPGIGKTTFFRYTVLSLISKRPRPIQFFPGETIIPIYVPLQAVDNTQPAPILTYLLRSYSYFRGERGKERLQRLGRKKMLLLVLDGYDEIYLPLEDKQNFARSELNLLSTDDQTVGWKDVPSELKPLYRDLRRCRVWLSSRNEFYQQQQLDVDEEKQRKLGRPDFVALSIKGLGNRAALVGNIFDLYRRRDASFGEALNEESLLHDIDSSEQEELIELSYNPLFLTVICYIYVQGLIAMPESKAWQPQNMAQLILTCINLLLGDLDEHRVLDLPIAERNPFRRRRSLFPEAKRQFLYYFASRLLTSGRTVFNEEQLVVEAKEFIINEYRGGDASEILKGLNSKRRLFARQLLNQGVFVFVETKDDTAYYDFPHRRFREVLAARYLDKPEHLDSVLSSIGNRKFTEFLYVFFTVSRFQNQILQAILARTSDSEEGVYYGTLAYDCLQRKPEGYDPTPLLTDFIRTRIDNHEPFRITKKILKHILPDRDFLSWIAQQFRRAIENRDRHTMAISGPILLEMNKQYLHGIFTMESPTALMEDEQLFMMFLTLAAITDRNLLRQYLENCRKDAQRFRLWCYVSITTPEVSLSFWPPIIRELSQKETSIFIDMAQTYNSGLISDIERSQELTDDFDVLAAIVRHIRTSKRLPKGDEFFVITRSVVQQIRGEPIRDSLGKFVGQIFFGAGFLKDLSLGRLMDGEILALARRKISLFGEVDAILAKAAFSVNSLTYFY